MRDFLGSLITALALVLLIPTTLILVSWNALPGERLYGLKRGLENVAFALTKDTPIATAFSLKFTDRRFSEANILLAQKGSTIGYRLLVAEAKKTKDVIVEKNDTQSAAQLVQNIETYQKTIVEKKLALETQPVVIPVPTQVTSATPRATAVQTPAAAVSTPIPVPTPQPVSQVVTDLDKTNDELEKIKDEVKKEIKEEPPQRGKDHEDSSH